MEIKLIPNEDFMQLCELTVDMYKEIDPNINAFQAINTLLAYINTGRDFVAIGLYDEGALVGFVTGLQHTEKTFYFSGIYVIMKNNEWSKKIIDFSFAHIQELGYTAWEVDATNPNICSIMEKYGAKVKCTRYRKEFE